MNNTSKRDIEILLVHVLNKPRSYLYAYPHQRLTSEQQRCFWQLWQRRLRGEPIAYIINKKMFWKLEFQVNASTLIPRPETEQLLELILDLLPRQSPCRVLELATGSGAVAISLAKECPNWQIFATDMSAAALALAEANAAQHAASNIQFYLSDWFEGLEAFKQAPVDAILANPPYIAEKDPHLFLGDVRFEPRCALVSGRDGLKALRQIIDEAPYYLRPGGMLALEHGYDQAATVRAAMRKRGFVDVATHSDLAGCERITVGFVQVRNACL